MPLINWSSHFSIGLPRIDEHHQHLFFLLNRLYDDFTSQDSTTDCGLLIDELIDYATYHFAAEEQWMRDKNYPNLAIHESEHSEFSGRILKISKSYAEGERHVPLELLAFLHNWLAAHIMRSDVEFSHFLETMCEAHDRV